MKKAIKLLVIMTVMFIGLQGVNAADEILTCSYSIDFNNVNVSRNLIIDFSVVVYEGKDIKADFTELEDYQMDPNLGSEYLNPANSNFEKNYNNAAQEGGAYSCPDLAFYHDGGSFRYNLLSLSDDVESEIEVAKGTSSNVADNITIATETQICDRVFSLRNKSYKISVYFYYLGSNKMWKIKNNTTNSYVGSDSANSAITYDGYTYMLDETIKEKAYLSSETCYYLKIYAQTDDAGSTGNIVFQNEEPSEVENASYSANDASEDDGLGGTVLENSKEEVSVTSGNPCSSLIGDNTIGIIQELYKYLKILVPMIIILMGTLDFIKVVTIGKEEDMKKAQSNFIKRIIVGIVFFIVPVLVSLILKISGITEAYDFGSKDSDAIFCIFINE